MSIKLRLALLLGLLLLVFIFGLFALRTLERRQLSEAVAAAQRDDAKLVANWIDLRSASLRRFVDDVAGQPQLDAFAASPADHELWAKAKLDEQLPTYGVDALWIASPDGALIHSARRGGLPELALPVPPDRLHDLAAPDTGVRAYFHPTMAGLAEVRALRLDSRAGPGPWLFVARIWDAPYLERLGELTDGEASLAPPSVAGIAASLHDFAPGSEGKKPAPIVVQRMLPGWDGAPMQTLRLVKQAPDISFRIDSERLNARVFLIFGLCLIASLGVSLHQWVLRPLGWITDSLSRHDTAPIKPLIESRTELTRVARLIVTSFEHREQLRREVAERRIAENALKKTLDEHARLGRDLHDGVIQSIYAAGMGIAAARKRVFDDPGVAERHLAQVATTLNQTIHEVRNFITGLEPETADDPVFAESVARLFATMNGDGAARAEIHIDEALASRMPMPLRTDLLLLLRESISNALRHGCAGRVEIRLAPHPGDPALAQLEIIDDGEGFDPCSVKRGRGLDNLFARAAAHGAQASLDAAPGRGTRLCFTWSLPSEDDEIDDTRIPPPQAS